MRIQTSRWNQLVVRERRPPSNPVSSAQLHHCLQITWLHKLVYGIGRQPVVYDKITIILFIQGYLMSIESERPHQWEPKLKHLTKLMADVAIYGWEPVQAYHAIRL